jgi:DNA-nicking Smr family endonuclease
MSRRRDLSEEEETLWSTFAGSIKPLRPAKSAAKKSTAVRERARAPPSAVAPLAVPSPAKPPPLAPFDRRLKQRVARGREAIDVRIDLHGMIQSQALVALLRFMRRAQTGGARVALIVTGKGTGKGIGKDIDRSDDAESERGVLRRQVPLWLALPEFRPFVVGFESAHVSHGGQGALYVRLRRPR